MFAIWCDPRLSYCSAYESPAVQDQRRLRVLACISLGSRRYSDSGIPFLGWRISDLRFRTSIGHRKTAARNPTVTSGSFCSSGGVSARSGDYSCAFVRRAHICIAPIFRDNRAYIRVLCFEGLQTAFRASSVALQTQPPSPITFPKRPPWARSRSRPPRSSKNYQTLLWRACPRFYDLRFELMVSDLPHFQTQAESASK